MKYEVIHSVLMGAAVSFKQGDEVSPEQLTEAGFDVEFLANAGAIEPMRGTFQPGEVPAADLSAGKRGEVRTVTGQRSTATAVGVSSAESPDEAGSPNAPAGRARAGRS